MTRADLLRPGIDVVTADDLDVDGKKVVLYDPTTGQMSANGALVSGAGNLDLLVYGANPGGLFAAMAAAKRGARVAVLQPDAWVGGMLTGGLSATDISVVGWSALVTGMANDFYADLAAEVGQRQEVFLRNGYAAEPHVVERVLRRWLAAAGIKVVTNAELLSVSKTGTRITSVQTSVGTYAARTYIDGTYEGDLIAAAGCSFVIGREANATYGETYNGIRAIAATTQFDNAVDPYVTPGVPASGLLPGISSDALGTVGGADTQVMSFNYRLCAAKSGTFKIAMPEPDSYNPLNYELIGRHAAAAGAGWTTLDGQALVVPLQGATKYDWNSGSYPQGTNYISPVCTEYITATYARRRAIQAEIKNYTLGWFKFMRTDTRVNAGVRGDAFNWGLSGDEFEAYGGFSPQLYVREGRRLVGDFVATEADVLTAKTPTDGVATAYYPLDSHHVRRIVVGGQVKNEGYLLQAIPGTFALNQVPLRVMKPKAAECTNLLATYAISATHTAFGALRMEPIGMQFGEAAGLMAYLAAQRNVDVSAVSSAEVLAMHDRFRFAVPGGAILAHDNAAPFNGGTATKVVGSGAWNVSATPIMNGHATHTVNTATDAYIDFAPNLEATGAYDVYALYVCQSGSLRSNATPIDVVHAGGTTSLTLQQNSKNAGSTPANAIGEGGNWVNLGRFTFKSGTPSANYVRFKGNTGGAVIESFKWVPAK